MAIIKAPDVPAPTAVLCWKESRLLTRCDRRAGHAGPHSWDHAEPAPSPDTGRPSPEALTTAAAQLRLAAVRIITPAWNQQLLDVAGWLTTLVPAAPKETP